MDGEMTEEETSKLIKILTDIDISDDYSNSKDEPDLNLPTPYGSDESERSFDECFSNSASDDVFECGHCSKTFLSKIEVITHSCIVLLLFSTAPREENYSSLLEIADQSSLGQYLQPNSEKFVCRICHKSCGNEFFLQMHYDKHTESARCESAYYECGICGERYSKVLKPLLDLHYRDHLIQCHKCNVCSSEFISKANLNIHYLKEIKTNHSCAVCDAMFENEYLLLSHYDGHAEEDSEGCKICNASFTHEDMLKLHYRNHAKGDFVRKNGSRTYSAVTAERKKIIYLCSAITSRINCSLKIHSSANEVESKDVLPIYPQIKFEDLHFDDPVPHEDLIAALYECKTISEQMEMLAHTLHLNPEDIQNRKKFCKTLESLFKPFFNTFKIQIFGSTANGFGFKGCDIDMSFETSLDEINERKRDVLVERPDIPFVNEVISGKVSPQYISRLPPKEQLVFMHNVLLEYYKESEKPTIFINAHVPLVRFYHDKLNLKCDLTLKNTVAYANTKLLHLYFELDKRVFPLMMTVRYWAKHLTVIGKSMKFNSYTISLMLIYFLQTRNPPILPSAEFISSISNNLEHGDMDDQSYLDIAKKILPSKNKQSL
ncbi:poly(A) RNA polymerase, mitochondrial, partial [Caerostris extrusa]